MAGSRVVTLGVAAIVAILALSAALLFATLPDGNAFNERVERIFVENDDLTSEAEIKLLEILAQSGTAFSDVLAGYRAVIFVLLILATGLLIASLVLVVAIVALNRRLSEIERQGMQIASLVVRRSDNTVLLNDLEFRLTEAAIETLAVLAEARLDGDVMTGAEIEGVISGRSPDNCEEAAGATRIKRLRDALGNQVMAELLIKTVARKGYRLDVDPDALRVE